MLEFVGGEWVAEDGDPTGIRTRVTVLPVIPDQKPQQIGVSNVFKRS